MAVLHPRGLRWACITKTLLVLVARGVSAEAQLTEAEAIFGNFSFDFRGCTEHLQQMDWNENVSQEVWKVRYTRAVNCMKYSERLVREAGRDRPAAMSGVHVPTVIVPTESEELPELPPFYFVLPFWDMVVSNRVRLLGSYDSQELGILRALTPPGASFVDIGANVGAVTVPVAAHVGIEGAVYAFEPFRQVFQFLNANVAANGLSNVFTFQHALSDASAAPQTIRAPAPTLLAGQNAGMSGVFQGRSTVPTEQTSQLRERMEDVSIRTLDSFQLPRVDVVKIDVEGHASRVLAGGMETLRAHRPILWFEESGNAPPEMLLEADLRYWCTQLADSTTEEQFLCVPQERHAEVQQKLDRT